MWHDCLAEYLAAKARHAEADRLYHRAGRTLRKLARWASDDRAYELAGMSLADNRCLRAYAEQRRARDKLKAALTGRISTMTRLSVAGRVLCAHLPRAANDRQEPLCGLTTSGEAESVGTQGQASSLPSPCRDIYS